MDAAVEEQVRGARTQSLFRDVNERVRAINATFSEVMPLGDWVCECFDQSCSERIALSPEEYEQVRADAARFAVAPGHVEARIEDVVEQNERYWVVEKFGVGAVLCVKVDPRRVGLRGQNGTVASAAGETGT